MKKNVLSMLAVFVLASAGLAAPSGAPAAVISPGRAMEAIKARNLSFRHEIFVVLVKNGSAKDVELFLAAGMAPDTKGKQCDTALMIASSGGHTDIAAMLLEKGARPNLMNENGMTALMYAAESGHAGVLKLLLEKGADPRVRDASGSTALSKAVKAGQKEIAELLRKSGVKE